MTPLTHSITAYQTIRERILALEADIDDTTLADTLEGLTDLHEVVAAVVRSALIDEAMVEGLKGHIQTLQDRLRRISSAPASGGGSPATPWSRSTSGRSPRPTSRSRSGRDPLLSWWSTRGPSRSPTGSPASRASTGSG